MSGVKDATSRHWVVTSLEPTTREGRSRRLESWKNPDWTFQTRPNRFVL